MSSTTKRAGDALPVFSVASPRHRIGVDGLKAVRGRMRTEGKGKSTVDNFACKSFHPSREWTTGDGTTQEVSRTRKNIFEPEGHPMPRRKPQNDPEHNYRIYPLPGDRPSKSIPSGAAVPAGGLLSRDPCIILDSEMPPTLVSVGLFVSGSGGGVVPAAMLLETD
jgi:hypothetical protein